MDVLDDGPDPEPGRLAAYGEPQVLAVTGFVLAVASLLGFGILSGNIVLALFGGFEQQTRDAVVAAALLGAALAAVPVGVGLTAVRRLTAQDPLWVGTLARTAVLVGGLAVLVRLAQAGVQAASDAPHLVF